MLRTLFRPVYIPKRNFKNFGHKRQPIPLPTTLWHGFLTLTFIGLGLEWDVISKFMFGSEDYDSQIDAGLRPPQANQTDRGIVVE